MIENSYEKNIINKIDLIKKRSYDHLNQMEENFNELKDAFYELTKKYEFQKMNEGNMNIEEKNNDLYLNPLNEIINQLISEEHNNNINFINNSLNKYNSNTCIPNIVEQTKIKKILIMLKMI